MKDIRLKPFQPERCRVENIRRQLRRLSSCENGWVSFNFLNVEELNLLKQYASSLPKRLVKTKEKKGYKRVIQDFKICFPAPRSGVFDSFVSCLESCILQATESMVDPPFHGPVTFNDFAVQHYEPNSLGIGVHRDGYRYKKLVVIVTLSGRSRLYSAKSRDACKKKRINDSPGRLVFLSAPGFAGQTDDKFRPLHGVDMVSGGRLSIGLRYEETRSTSLRQGFTVR